MFKWIDTIIFDLEWVIIDTKDIWKKVDEKFFLDKWLKYDISVKNKVVGKTLEEVVIYYKNTYKINEKLDILIKEYFLIVNELFYSEIKYINWFLEFFTYIESKFNICVATSIDKNLLSIVENKFNIHNKFKNKVFSSSSYNLNWSCKEDIFKFAIKSMNSDNKKCIIIEDSPLWIRSAKNLWVKSIALESNFNRNELLEADYIFKDLLELKIIFSKVLI